MIPLDYLIMKVAGKRELEYMPLVELAIAPGDYDDKMSTEATVVFSVLEPDGNCTKFPRDDFRKFLEAEVYNGKEKVIDFVIRPAGMSNDEPVKLFLERYSK